jgi:formate hydrogenlyase subunit 6/NADH:ubiquinone oxidoreductase subunit I
MDALKLEDSPKATNKKGKAAVLNPDRCIGCGVCAHKCPTESLILERREEIIDPPLDPRDYTKRFLTDRQIAREREGRQ